MRTVVLTAADTNYELADLLIAENASERIHCAQIVLQAPSTNTNPILIGDGSLSATEFGYSLPASGVLTIRGAGDGNTLSLGSLKVRSAGAAQALTVLQTIV